MVKSYYHHHHLHPPHPPHPHDVDHGPSYPQLIEIVQKNSNYEGTWVAFTNNKEDVFVVKVEL